eukprot:1260497-Amphidinium_carterae.2
MRYTGLGVTDCEDGLLVTNLLSGSTGTRSTMMLDLVRLLEARQLRAVTVSELAERAAGKVCETVHVKP